MTNAKYRKFILVTWFTNTGRHFPTRNRDIQILEISRSVHIVESRFSLPLLLMLLPSRHASDLVPEID